MKKNLIIMISLLTSLLFTACQGDKNEAVATNHQADDSITAVGSSALQPLVEAAAEQFMNEQPNATINIQGGGSGTGLSKISEGAVEIGNSDIFSEEKDGIDTGSLVDHQVAIVGIGPVVHPDVGINDISQQQLIDIFTGDITNWKEVGGPDQDIVIIHRAEGSGTRVTFEQFALDGATPISAQEQDSSGTVRKMVSETPGAISYLAFSYFDDSIRALFIDGKEPNQKNVETNEWEVWSYQHMYTNGEATGTTKDFLDYMLSEDVQEQLLPELDYLSITGMQAERDADGNIIEK